MKYGLLVLLLLTCEVVNNLLLLAQSMMQL